MPEDLYLTLLYQRLDGDLNNADEARLEAWLAESPDHRALAAQVEAAWNASADLKMEPEVDLDADFARLELAMDAVEQAEEQGDAPTRELSPGKRSLVHRRPWLVAAAILLLAVVGHLVLPRESKPQAVYLTLAAQNEIRKVDLFDGSQVTLYPGSELRYPEGLVEGARPVELTGRAWFEVARDEAHPFVVKLPGGQVKVLGTRFALDVGKGEHSLQVTEGKVSLQLDFEGESQLVEAGQRCEWDRQTQTFHFIPGASANELAWHTQKLVYEGVPLRQIVSDLQENGAFALAVDRPELLDCALTCKLDLARSPAQLVEKLALLFGGSWRQTGPGQYTIEEGNC